MTELLKIYPAAEIAAFAEFYSQETEKSEFLNRLKNGAESLTVWKHWGIQKYKAAVNFIPFLKSGLKKAEGAGLLNTAATLYENLCDEMGLEPGTENVLQVGSHEKWRVDFYNAIGIIEQNLQNDLALPSTNEYAKTLEKITSHSNVYEHVGALVAMEYAIAKEMEMIETGLDSTPGLKSIFDKSSQQGRKNRLYVTHHAAHDLKQHFPELVNAVTLDFNAVKGSNDRLDSICNGARTITEARINFYDGLHIF